MKDIANPIFDENLRNQPIFDKNILRTTMLNVIKKQIKEQAFINQRIRLQRKIKIMRDPGKTPARKCGALVR